MNREQLMAMRPTAQVRTLAAELLQDGRIHSRQEIVEYVKEQGRRKNLPVFREGHLAGGIREAVTNLGGERLERGTFRIPPQSEAVPDGAEPAEVPEEIPAVVSCSRRAEEVCDDARKRLTEISREIDYVSADEAELKLLLRLREYVRLLEEFGRAQEAEEQGN